MFVEVRAEIIAKEQNSAQLFRVARELESRTHARSPGKIMALISEAKSIIGVFADFVGAKRTALVSSDFVTPPPTPALPPAAPPSTPVTSPNPVVKEAAAAHEPGEYGKSSKPETDEVQKGNDENPKLL